LRNTHHSEQDLRRAERATWGPRPQNLEIKILRFVPLSGGSALGFLDVETASGLLIRDCKLMPGQNGGAWIAMPSVKQVDRDGNPIPDPKRAGKPLYREIVSFRDRGIRDKFTAAVLDALGRQYPDALP
jgi:DNA-binding cell septation regulator SpoVG